MAAGLLVDVTKQSAVCARKLNDFSFSNTVKENRRRLITSLSQSFACKNHAIINISEKLTDKREQEKYKQQILLPDILC